MSTREKTHRLVAKKSTPEISSHEKKKTKNNKTSRNVVRNTRPRALSVSETSRSKSTRQKQVAIEKPTQSATQTKYGHFVRTAWNMVKRAKGDKEKPLSIQQAHQISKRIGTSWRHRLPPTKIEFNDIVNDY